MEQERIWPIYCDRCGKEYLVDRRQYELWEWTQREDGWPLLARRYSGRSWQWPRVLCLSVAGQAAREGFGYEFRWHVPRQELELLVAPGRDAKKGFWWPFGLVLWQVKAPPAPQIEAKDLEGDDR